MTGVEDVALHLLTVGAAFAVALLRRKPKPPVEKQCASLLDGSNGKNDRCVAVPDARCLGGQCTHHCRRNCGGKCLE